MVKLTDEQQIELNRIKRFPNRTYDHADRVGTVRELEHLGVIERYKFHNGFRGFERWYYRAGKTR